LNDVIVIGAGLIGSAAAKYLAMTGADVRLVGVREGGGSGVHASHYDEARITRKTDPDLIWATLAERSIDQYAAIETSSGVHFHDACGHLRCDLPESHPDSLLRELNRSMRGLGFSPESLSVSETNNRFPYLHFDEKLVFNYEGAPSGILNPRALISAQLTIFADSGGVLERERVDKVQRAPTGDFDVFTTNGTFRARKVLICTGPYTNLFELTPGKLNLSVKPETVLLAEVNPEMEPVLSGFPGIVWNFDHHPVLPYAYVLPPVRYPDGKVYVKIGADHDRDVSADSVEALDRYMRGSGSTATVEGLKELLFKLLPSLADARTRSKPCLLTYSPKRNPMVDEVEKNWFVAVAGCGKSAKSSDHTGLLAAQMLQGETWQKPFERHMFSAS